MSCGKNTDDDEKSQTTEVNISEGETKTTSTNGSNMKETVDLDNVAYHPMFATDENYEKSITAVDKALKRAAFFAVFVWLVLLSCVYCLAPEDSFERLSGVELSASYLAVSLVLVSNISRVVPLVYTRGKRAFSPVIIASIVVQSIAFASDSLMAFVKIPIVIDPITNSRVNLFRWCEWIPLAFLMTFLTEAVDITNQASVRTACIHAICQGLSTSSGLFFPFAPNFWSWCLVMSVSVFLFFILHFRCVHKYKILCKTDPGSSLHEMEVYERVSLSFRLMSTCAIMWTILVVLYFVGWIAPIYASKDSILSSPAMPMITESFCEIWSKVFYLVIVVDAHNCLFDEGVRAERRLEELRYMMSVVWESSSDVISISVKNSNSGNAVTMVSPTFWEIINTLNGKTPDKTTEMTEYDAIVFDLSKNDFSQYNESLSTKMSESSSERKGSKRKKKHLTIPQNVHTTQLGGKNLSRHFRKRSGSYNSNKSSKNLSSKELLSLPGVIEMSTLVVKAWESSDAGDNLLTHGLEHENEDGSVTSIHCEAKITRLDGDTLVIILRDISERCKRFEAEKKIIKESTARRKDAEANRFTRHEVKNGLLAAIGLTDSLREGFLKNNPFEKDKKTDLDQYGNLIALDDSGHEWDSDDNKKYDIYRCILELDTTLREVLDTILAQAMARDLIHEVYLPRVERVDICSILRENCIGIRNSLNRFPIIAYPDPLPIFLFDPQLLRLVFRNALSNACKYGRKNGKVVTELRFDRAKKEFKMDVINEPGENHDELLALGKNAEDAVFLQGKRLFPSVRSFEEGEHSNHPSVTDLQDLNSSGDGAWIINKCAKTLGGEVKINFLTDKTVFSLRCPATPVQTGFDRNNCFDLVDFKLPKNTWGIAIDDSKIQRKLMMKFLSLAGIVQEKIAIKGKDADEIQNFTTFVVDTISSNPNDYFLVIADENLDIVDLSSQHKTISGSYCIEQVRRKLPPELEKNMLAMIRSANDSSPDIALYTKRAHAFLPKTLIQKDRVMESLAPLWRKRFGDDKSSEGTQQTDSQHSEIETDTELIGREEIIQTVEIIDKLCSEENPDLWPDISDRLHILKGDIKTMSSNVRIMSVAEAIDHLRGPEYPDDLVKRWKFIRSIIMSFI